MHWKSISLSDAGRVIVTVRGGNGSQAVACCRGATIAETEAALAGLVPVTGHQSHARRVLQVQEALASAGLWAPRGRPRSTDGRVYRLHLNLRRSERDLIRARAEQLGVSLPDLVTAAVEAYQP